MPKREAAETLHPIEERYRSLVHNQPIGIFRNTTDEKGRFLMVNPALARMLGYDDTDPVLGITIQSIYANPEDRKRFVEKLLASGSVTGYEIRLKRRDGSIFWGSVTANVVRDEQGAVQFYDGMVEDITDRKLVELELARYQKHLEELVEKRTREMTRAIAELKSEVQERRKAENLVKKNEEKYRSLVENLNTGIYRNTLTSPSRFLEANTAMARIFGYDTVEEFLQITTEELYRDSFDRTAFKKAILEKGYVVNEELLLKKRDGTPIIGACTAQMVFDDDGTVKWIDGVIEDITERKRAEEEVIAAKEAAEQASLAKSEFLANMSHEIRTPMNGVLGMAEILLDTDLTEEQRSHAETICKSAGALLSVINDILDFSKIEAGKIDLTEAPFDFRNLVEDVGQFFALNAQQKEIELVIRYAPDTPRRLKGDGQRIRQILMNFVGNAIKFTQRGHVLVDVECLRREEERATIRTRISDTGIGIPVEAQAYIFEKFTQADTSSTRMFEGTGLGLAINQQLVAMMGGEIGFESEVGRGSTFFFTLTLPRAQDSAWRIQTARELAGVRILVVDDNEINRRVVTEQLSAWDVACQDADSAEAALTCLRRAADEGRSYQVAILDFHMPGMDGLELARVVKRDERLKGTILILLASMVSAVETNRARAAGFSASLTKPVRASQLLSTLLMAMDVPDDRRPMSDSDRGGSPADEGIPPGPIADCRVLVVEDNVANQKVARIVLEKLGCRVDLAANGQEALERVEAEDYHLVFMDCQMPVMDGYKATRLIRQMSGPAAKVPVVAMTAHVMQGDRERCLAAGMNDYTPKPIDRKEVGAILHRFVGPTGGHGPALTEKVLIVEDDPVCHEVIRKAVRRISPGARIRSAGDGVEACVLLGSFLPDLLICDLVMPQLAGGAVVGYLRRNERFRRTRVVVVTGLEHTDSQVDEVRKLGVRAVLHKPFDEDRMHQALCESLSEGDGLSESAPEMHGVAPVVSEPRAPDVRESRELDDGPTLDQSVLLALLGDDPESLKEVISAYTDLLPGLLDDLNRFLAAGDLEKVRQTAHSIKGGAANLGGERSRRLAAELEAAARAQDQDRCQRLLAPLKVEAGRLCQALAEQDWRPGR